jgi:hypothetical protein
VATFDHFPALVCKNCSRPIRLPPAKRPDTSNGQGVWPAGGSRRNFLCPACRYVHGYAAPDIQPLLPNTDPRKAGTSYNVVYIRLECEVQGCASILRIRTLMAIDKVPHKEAPRLRVATDIYCAAPLRLTVWLSTHNVTRIGRSETVGIGGCDSALKSARVRLLKGFLWRWVNGRRVLTYLLILGCCVCVVPLFQRSEVPFDNLFNS